MFYRLCCCLTFVFSFAIGGCNPAPEGPVRYELSGTVTFQGQPVPQGQITFVPDNESGNKGPGSGAPIVDGKYATPTGKGHVGGAHRVLIVGYDGVPTTMEGETLADGTPLFQPHTIVVDLPQKDGEYNFEVPDPSNDSPE